MRDLYRFIDNAEVKLRVRETGKGAAIVFIHGWALDSEMWVHQVDALAPEYRTIAYDRRGFGASSGAPSIAADVIDLERVMDALSIERAAIVGMSQGARVAALYADAHPDRVSHLILDSPPALTEDASAQHEIPIERYRTLVRAQGMEAFEREWLKHPLTRLHTRDAETQALLKRIVARYPGRDLLAPVIDAPRPKLDLHSLTSPTLILNGAYDLESRQLSGRRLERLLFTSRRVIVPTAAHLPCLDNPSFYNEALRSFLQDIANADPKSRDAFDQKENRS